LSAHRSYNAGVAHRRESRDPTPRIAAALQRGVLAADEVVHLAVPVQRPGTFGAQLESGVRAGTSGALGTQVYSTKSDAVDTTGWNRWAAELVERHGADPQAARQAIRLYLALTDQRILVVRRHYLTGGPREVLISWPLADVDRVAVSAARQALTLTRGEAELRLELPKSLKHLPAVYRELPKALERLRRAG